MAPTLVEVSGQSQGWAGVRGSVHRPGREPPPFRPSVAWTAAWTVAAVSV